MPISPLTLQRRFAELGRIRLGAKEGGKGRPMKLAAFRFTSPNRRYINDLATLYGGEAAAWDNNGKPEFEVFTDATSVPVIAMKGGLSQWMETWSGGGCVHRCDGEVSALDGERCDPKDRAHIDAKPTTRLSLMLPELDAIGAWRMESHGWNAAAEIPAVAELAQFVGDLVPAHLNMIERRSIRDGKTSRFVVPVLDLQIGAARLREIVAEKSGTAELAAPAAERPALASAPAPTTEAPAVVPVDQYGPATTAVIGATTLVHLRSIWDKAKEFNLIGPASAESPEREEFIKVWKAKAHEINDATSPTVDGHPEPVANPDGTYDAHVVDEPTTTSGPTADAVWQQILAAAGAQGMSLPDVEDDFAQKMGGVSSGEASVSELQAYLSKITEGAAA